MESGTRREILAVCTVLASAGCMETPETTPEQDERTGGSDGENASTIDTDADTEDGTQRDGSQNVTDETSASNSGTFPADVWFHTDRVRDEVNTFDVSVKIDIRDSSMVRVEIGRHFSEAYSESGTHLDVARVDLGTTLRAEAETDGEWHDVNVTEAPVRNSEAFGD